MFYIANNTLRQLMQHKIKMFCVIQTKFDFVFAISKALSSLRTVLWHVHSFTFCLPSSNKSKKPSGLQKYFLWPNRLA